MPGWIISQLPGIFEQTDVSLSPGVTLLVGPNHSGKTVFLRHLAHVFGNRDERTRGAVHIQIEGNEIQNFASHVRPDGGYSLRPDRIARRKRPDDPPFWAYSQPNIQLSNTGGVVRLADSDKSYFHSLFEGGSKFILVNPAAKYTCNIKRTTWKELKENGENIAAAIDTLQEAQREEFLEWNRHIRNAFPLVEQVFSGSVSIEGQKNLYVKTKGHGAPIPIDTCGTGIAQCALAFYAVMFAPKYSFILLDEGTHHLHPYATKAMLDSLVGLAGERVIVAATHDPTAVRSSKIERFLLVRTTEGKSQIAQVNSEGQMDVLREIGLDYSDLLFADGVLIVEGKSEERILREAQKGGEFPKSIGIASLEGLRFLTGNRRLRREILRLSVEILKANRGGGVSVAFALDPDDRKQEVNAAIASDAKDAGGMAVHFLTRRSLENYFLEADLVAEFCVWLLNQHGGDQVESVDPHIVKEELEKVLKSTDVAKCDAVKVLNSIVSPKLPGFDYEGRKAEYALQFYKLSKQRRLGSMKPVLAEFSDAVSHILKSQKAA